MAAFSPSFFSLDLEMNQPSRRIIQVGICIGAANQMDSEYVTRQWLVDPEEPIAPEITELTGISDQAILRESVGLPDLARELDAVLAEHPCFVNPVTWGGGDSTMLLAAFRAVDIRFPRFGRRWLDVKTMHSMIALASGKQPAGGLASVMGRYKQHFKGEPHRADVDAFNTLRLFFNLLARQRTMDAIAALAKGV